MQEINHKKKKKKKNKDRIAVFLEERFASDSVKMNELSFFFTQFWGGKLERISSWFGFICFKMDFGSLLNGILG